MILVYINYREGPEDVYYRSSVFSSPQVIIISNFRPLSFYFLFYRTLKVQLI